MLLEKNGKRKPVPDTTWTCAEHLFVEQILQWPTVPEINAS